MTAGGLVWGVGSISEPWSSLEGPVSCQMHFHQGLGDNDGRGSDKGAGSAKARGKATSELRVAPEYTIARLAGMSGLNSHAIPIPAGIISARKSK